MLSIKETGIVLNIIVHCKRIEEKTNGLNENQFVDDLDVQQIVCFNIFQIGELAKKLEASFIQQYDQVPWSSIKGMRDRIGHGYGTINLSQVWKTVSQDITPLREYCEEILKNNQ